MKTIWSIDENKIIYGLKLLWYSGDPRVVGLKILGLFVLAMLTLKLLFIINNQIQSVKVLASVIKNKAENAFLTGGSTICELFLLKSKMAFAIGAILLILIFSFVIFAGASISSGVVFAIVLFFYLWALIFYFIHAETEQKLQNERENAQKTQEKSIYSNGNHDNLKSLNRYSDRIIADFSHNVKSDKNNIEFDEPSKRSVIQRSKEKKEYDKKFYESQHWRELRFHILKSQGRKCALCHTTEGVLHVDHIKPRSKYPHLELDPCNLQVLCEDCNIGKTDSDDGKNKFYL